MSDVMQGWFELGALAGATVGICVGWFIAAVSYEWRLGDLTPADRLQREEDVRLARAAERREINAHLRRITRRWAATLFRIVHGSAIRLGQLYRHATLDV